MKDERRIHRRATLEVPVDVQHTGTKHKGFRAKTINLSAGGFYCRIPFFLPILTKVKVSMIVPVRQASGKEQDHVISCSATVVRTVPAKPSAATKVYEIGCFFTDIESLDRLVIEEYLAEKGLAKK
jgi:c-di-GMP-binding flagellar brake protein YcgR